MSALRKTTSAALLALALAPFAALAQQRRPMSPRGTAHAHVGGKWESGRYSGGSWIEVDYGRPIKRGRESLFGSGAEYGKKLKDEGALWRMGANETTRLKTEVALEIGGKKLAPGEYDLFMDLKEGAWTLVVSTQPYQTSYDPSEKAKVWGAYNYDAKYDVVKAPMRVVKSPHSIDQLTIGFLDVTDKGGKLAVAWDREVATVDFKVAP